VLPARTTLAPRAGGTLTQPLSLAALPRTGGGWGLQVGASGRPVGLPILPISLALILVILGVILRKGVLLKA
jgi:hypothetical protein